MNKIVLLTMVSLVVLSTFSIFAPKVEAEENNLLLTSSACITDDTNDWIGGIGLDYMDITSACIVNIDYWTVRFEMTVVGDIPEDPSPKFIGYVWGLDLDQDGIFNEFPPYAPDYTDLNVRVAFDPDPTHGDVFGWHGFIDGKYGPQILYESFSFIANTVSFTLSLSSIYDPISFLWEVATVGSVEDTNLPSDIAPNYGLPRASWSAHPLRIIDGLRTNIEELGSEGEVDNQGIVRSLIAKLNVARKLVERGKEGEALMVLEDFAMQVHELSEIHITTKAAEILIESADYIISHL